MKLLVFGATGATGREIVHQALAQGHVVTAFARNPEAIENKHHNLKVMRGDILDYTTVQRAVKGQDVILSALGIKILKKNAIISQGTKNILTAMEETKVKRFICISSIGVGKSKAQQHRLGLLYNYLIIPFMIRNMFDDKEVQEKYIMESNTDWTIVRPAILTNGPRTGYRTFEADDTSVKAKISRADVASCMLSQISDTGNIHKAISISH